jgi:chromosome segregation ATPase
MDINQAARMIEWLDEERRRDKSTIATLEERLAQQQELVDTLSKRLNSMESDQTMLRSQVVPAGRDTEVIDQLRKEMQQLVESIESKRLTAEREAERRAELNRESIMRNVRELTDKATRLERQTTELPAINVEKDRLAQIVQTLQQRVDDLYKKLDEPDRRIVFRNSRSCARRLTASSRKSPCWKTWPCVTSARCWKSRTASASAATRFSSLLTSRRCCCNSATSRCRNWSRSSASRTAP